MLLVYRKLIPSIRLCGHCQMEYLAKQQLVQYRSCQEMQLKEEDINWSDTILLGRLDSWYERKLAEKLYKAGKYIIYILDDDLLNVPNGIDSYLYYSQESVKKNICRIMEVSDAILSPSPRLLKSYAIDGRQAILVEEPVIDPKAYNPHDLTKPVKIGFAGSIDRTQDIEFTLKDALIRIKKKYADNVQFEFFGAIPSFAKKIDAKCIPYCDSYDKYRNILNSCDWDIGLAPMPDTPFHACKHYNKFMEYAAACCIGVFSDVEPYSRLRTMNIEPKILVNGGSDAWYSALAQLIENRERLEMYRKQAFEVAMQRMSISVTADMLYDELKKCANKPTNKDSISYGLWRLKALNLLMRIKSAIVKYSLKILKMHIG